MGFYLTVAILAPVLATHDPAKMALAERILPPSASHLFGTDEYGRDLYSRTLLGARLSFQVGFLTMAIAGVVGSVIGLLSGYAGGWVDLIAMRIIDAIMAFPGLLLALAIMAFIGAGLQNIITSLSIIYMPVFARLARSGALSLKMRDFVEAARSTGAGDLRILFRHILPNTMSPLLVQATLTVAYAVLAEAALSFLGAGIPQPAPSWGNALADGRDYFRDAPWISIIPGLAIAGLVLGINLLGDGLRDLLDPRHRR